MRYFKLVNINKSGLSIEDTAIRMDVPVEYVKSCLESLKCRNQQEDL